MALFRKKTHMHYLETSLRQLELRAAQLADRRALADAALAAATTARQAFRLEGDLLDEKLDAKLQNDVDVCLSKLTGLDTDIAALQAKITETEQRLDAERTAAERKAASEKLSRDLDAVEQALPGFLEAGRVFTGALEELHHSFEMQQMLAFVTNMMSQVEIASAFSLTELRGTVSRIATGDAPMPAPKPVAPPVVVAEPAPETRVVFSTRSLKWTENGRQRTALAFEDVALPLQLADKALRIGACVSLSHDMRKTHRGVRGPFEPDPSAVGIVDLDAVTPYSPARHESFGPVIVEFDRGIPERQFKTAGPRL